MAGQYGSPFRAPCGGWSTPKKGYLGGRYQHRNPAEDGIARFINVTKKDGVAVEDGDVLPADACANTTIDNNCYQESGVLNLSTCHKTGWKAVHATKNFHGTYGLTDDVLCGSCTTLPGKYRTITRRVGVSRTGTYFNGVDSADDSQTADISKTCTVGKNTGVITVSGCNYDFTPLTIDPEGTSYTGMGYSFVFDQVLAMFYVEIGCGGTVNVDTLSIPPGGTDPAPPDMLFFHNGLAFDDWLDAWGTTYDDGVNQYSETVDGASELTNSHFYFKLSWRHGINQTYSGGTWTDRPGLSPTDPRGHAEGSFEIEITLADWQTPGSLLGEVTTEMLGLWDIADDVQYPWRSDANCMVAPLVRRNEVTTCIDPDMAMPYFGEDPGGTFCNWVDPNASIYDGEIIGGPLPNGYGPHYSWILNEWAPASLPLTATHWGNPDPDNLVDGGCILWNGCSLTARKFAITKDVFPSYNFARPCGADSTAIWQNDPDFCTDPKLRFPSAPATCDPENQWNDDQPKGDYVLLAWEDNLCDNTGTFLCTQKCLEHKPCCPNVLSVGCDVETFCYGVNEEFPATFEPTMAANGGPGWRWARLPVTAMPDPLFEIPHVDCETSEQPAYVVPYVEARCAPPEGAPSLPADHPGGSTIPFGCPSETGWCMQPWPGTCATLNVEEDI